MDIHNAEHEQILFNILKNFTLSKIYDPLEMEDMKLLIDTKLLESVNIGFLFLVKEKLAEKGIDYTEFYTEVVSRHDLQTLEGLDIFAAELEAKMKDLGIHINDEEQNRVLAEAYRDHATRLFGSYIRSFPEERDHLLEVIGKFPEFETLVRRSFSFVIA